MGFRRRRAVLRIALEIKTLLERPRMITLVLAILLLNNPNSQMLYAEGAENVDIAETTMDPEELKRQNKLCRDAHSIFKRNESESYCEAIFDQFLCWGYARAGTRVSQNCPDLPYIDSNNIALRYCGSDGNWLDQNNQSSSSGWTDYINCFPDHLQDLLENVSKSADTFMGKITIARWTRVVEFCSLSTSCVSLMGALFIYWKFPRLLNHRTKIHRHLFSVLLVQGITTLLIYLDQETFMILPRYNLICVASYVVLETLTSISFAFMLVEGFNIYKLVTSTALRPRTSYRLLILFAYLIPTANTIVWLAAVIYKYGWDLRSCLFGYNLDSIYWILQGPRLLVILVNLTFMLIVIKILIEKLARNDVTEIQRIRKVVRATVFLMPLLGITNFISMMNAPLEDTTAAFAVWAICAYLSRSLQGFFVSVIYCFSNREVLEVVFKKPNAAFNEPNERATRLRTTEVEQTPREDETRLDITEAQQSITAVDLPYIDSDPEIEDEELENIELQEMHEVLVHCIESPQDPEANELTNV